MGKKKLVLSQNDFFEQSLLSCSDQEYDIPQNWIWTKMGVVAKWGSGGTPSRNNKEYYNGTIPWVKTGELNNGFLFDTEEKITPEAIKKSSAKLFPINSVLIAMYGATIGKVAILGIEATTNQACACGIANNSLNYKYLFYYAISQQDSFVKAGKGGAQPNISQEIIKSHPFPLPPLPEQQRIVDRIESLFEKLDQAKGLIQDALDSFENRKAAILHKAFSGELTKKWREENCVGMESWNRYMLKDVCILPITDGTHQTPTYCTKEEGGVPFISAKDVTSGKINWEKIKYITPELHVKLYERVAPQRDDVLLAKNGTTGIAAMVETDMVFDIYVTLALLRPRNEVIMPKYLLRVVNSPNVKRQFDEHLTGIGVPNLHLKDIRVVEIDVPLINEQVEIVNIIDDFIENEQQAKELLKETYMKIDSMKKSILARAFRGELGTNDPTEKSAIELLKTVIANDLSN